MRSNFLDQISQYYQDIFIGVLVIALVLFLSFMMSKTPKSNDHYFGHDDDDEQL